MIPGRQCTPVDGRRGRAFTATTAPRTRSTAAARSLERDSSASIRLSSLAWHPRPACSRLVPAGIGRMARGSRGRVAGGEDGGGGGGEGGPPPAGGGAGCSLVAGGGPPPPPLAARLHPHTAPR